MLCPILHYGCVMTECRWYCADTQMCAIKVLAMCSSARLTAIAELVKGKKDGNGERDEGAGAEDSSGG